MSEENKFTKAYKFLDSVQNQPEPKLSMQFYNLFKTPNLKGGVELYDSCSDDKSVQIIMKDLPFENEPSKFIYFQITLDKIYNSNIPPTIKIIGDICNTSRRDMDSFLFSDKINGTLSASLIDSMSRKTTFTDQMVEFLNKFNIILANTYKDIFKANFKLYNNDAYYIKTTYFPWFTIKNIQQNLDYGGFGSISIGETYIPEDNADDNILLVSQNTRPLVKVCLKTIVTNNTDKDFERLNREIINHSICSNENISKLYGITVDQSGHICLVTEYCEKGNLFSFVANENYSEQMFFYLILGAISGVKYLSENGIVHRDIKPENIVVTNNLTAKIIDLGFSRLNIEESENQSSCGSQNYASPEAYRKQVTVLSDVYSLAVSIFVLMNTMFEHLYPQTAFQYETVELATTKYRINCLIQQKYYPLYLILKQGIEKDPSKRCDIQKLHKAFSDYYESNIVRLNTTQAY